MTTMVMMLRGSRHSAPRGFEAKGIRMRSQIGERCSEGWGWNNWIFDFRWMQDLRLSIGLAWAFDWFCRYLPQSKQMQPESAIVVSSD